MRRFYLQLFGREPIDVTGMGTFVIGREGDLLVHGHGVSRKHCMLALPKKPEESTYLCDGNGTKASSNGTFVNKKLYTRDALEEDDRGTYLQSNDLITIGTIAIRYLEFEENLQSDDVNTTL